MLDRNLQILATEMFKTQRRLSVKILRKIFIPKTSQRNLYRNYILKAPSNSNSKLSFFFSCNALRSCYGMIIFCTVWYDCY